MFRNRLVFCLALLYAVLLLAVPTAQAAGTITLTPEADAWVSDDAPDANHGSDPALQVDGSAPIARSYLRFNGTVPAGAVVTRSTLRLNFASASTSGLDIRFVSNNSWSEGTITFNNAPTFTGPVASTTSVAAGWNDIGVPLLTPGTPISFAVTRASAESLTTSSREGTNSPQLVVEYAVSSTIPSSICSAVGCIVSSPTGELTMSWSTTVADFNGDGRQDYLLGRHGSQTLDRIYLQQPDGSFAGGVQFPYADRHGCTGGDVSGDGRIDIYCMIGGDGGEGFKQNELWIAQPDGTYVNQAVQWGVTEPSGRGRRPLLFDFNNDGRLDLYTTNFGPRADGLRSENILYLNSGGGTFEERASTATGSLGAGCVDDGDWDRDGYRDFIVCGSQLHLFHNGAVPPDPARVTEQSDSLLGSAVSFPRDVILSDLNGDGWDDLVIVTRTALQVRYNSALPTGNRFSTVSYETPLQDGQSAAVGDITGDGLPDIYVVQGFANNQNADDLILTGPSWSALNVPPAESGTGDNARFVDVAGHESVIVTNGRNYARGPVQFVSFQPNAPAQMPPPPQVGSSGASRPPGGPPGKAPLPRATRVIELASNGRCLARRRLRIRIHGVAGVKFKSVTAFVNKKRVRVVRRNLTAPFSLRRLPKKGKFTVSVVVSTSDGRSLSRSRRYRACA